MNEYIVLDIETTGFDVLSQKIIEIAALKVKDGEIIDKFQSFVYSDIAIPYRILQLTGIANADVLNAPRIDNVLPDFVNFAKGYIVIGHNVRFDLSFIYHNCRQLNIDYDTSFIDTLRFSRELFPELDHHRLSDVCELLSVENAYEHRALTDCLATQECFAKLSDIADNIGFEFITEHDSFNYIISYTTNSDDKSQSLKLRELHKLLIDITCDNVLTEDEVFTLKKWLDDNSDLKGQYPFDRALKVIEIALEDNILELHELEEMLEIFKGLVNPRFSQPTPEVAENIDFKDKSFCLTGDFASGTKGQMTKKLEEHGMINRSGVSGKLDYLIVGSNGSQAWKCGTYGGKIKKAFELNDSGKSICIISENDFLKLIDN